MLPNYFKLSNNCINRVVFNNAEHRLVAILKEVIDNFIVETYSTAKC